MPAIVEAEDDGLYVLKFRGAGQGPLALVAEIVVGEIGRALGLRVPEIVLMDVDEALGRNERDPEIHQLLRASIGLNLALDYLPGSVMYDAAAGDEVDSALASEIVWFDALLTNVDRTAQNPNMLWWHKRLYLIDHGAALYFHHDWRNMEQMARSRFPAIRDHVLLPRAKEIEAANERLHPKLSGAVFTEILEQVPEPWLIAGNRAGYVDYLRRRLAEAPFVEEALNARARIL